MNYDGTTRWYAHDYEVHLAEMAGGLVIRVKRNDGAAVHLVEGAADDNDNEDIGLSGDVVEVYFG